MEPKEMFVKTHKAFHKTHSLRYFELFNIGSVELSPICGAFAENLERTSSCFELILSNNMVIISSNKRIGNEHFYALHLGLHKMLRNSKIIAFLRV